MPFFRKYSMLLLSLLIFSGTAFADVDKDKDKDKKRKNTDMAALMARSAGKVADCNLGSASSDLDINNVRTRLFNNGGLFWAGGNALYEVPKGSGQQAIFASGIWIGGLADGELRVAAATYSDWEFWPGPLDAAGQAPADCSPFDRMFRVSRDDIRNYQATGVATSDMTDWPANLGAPVDDGDGNPDNYDLAGGDLPGILGDQSIWWVMNDAGNLHLTTETPPIGLEVQVLAFAFNQSGALGNTTYYKYKFIYKGSDPLTDVYLGLWSDPDLGDAGDDFVGSDSLLGLGFVMNGDDFDGGSSGYGSRPPALGYDFFQGPLVDNDGLDNNRDGDVDEAGERVAMSKFVYYNNNTTVQGNPNTAEEYYDYLSGRWRDGTPITFGGTGLGFSNTPTNYMFPANPPDFWSEDNPDGSGVPNASSDRRFIQSAGPFTMLPGDEQEIVYGIVWAQSANRLLSVNLLKQEDAKAQAAFDIDFDVPPVPDAVTTLEAEALSGSVVLRWNYAPTSNAYLEEYEVTSINVIAANPPDTTYDFEGYVVYQYDSPADNVGRVIAVYDKINAARTVVENGFDEVTGQPRTFLLAEGTNSGIRRQHVVPGLTNNREYYFGVQAYAYNAFSNPQWYPSAIRKVTVTPTSRRSDGRLLDAAGSGDVVDASTESFGGVSAEVVDPTSLQGTGYALEFFSETNGDLNYNIVVTSPDRSVVFSGTDYYNRFGRVAPQGPSAVTVDGLAFTINSPAEFVWYADEPYGELGDFDLGRPIQREFIIGPVDIVGGEIAPGTYHPPVGTVMRMYSVGDGVAVDGDCFGDGTASCFVGDFDGSGAADTVRAITQVTGGGGSDPCPTPGDAQCRDGERIVDYPFYATDDWSMILLTTQSYANLPGFAPNTYEIRFTGEQRSVDLGLIREGGSIAENIFSTGDNTFAPYEVWDIGDVRPGGANDPADDVRMLAAHFSDNGMETFFDYRQNTEISQALFNPPWPFPGEGISNRIYAYYPIGATPAERNANAAEYDRLARAAVAGPILPGDAFAFDVEELLGASIKDLTAAEREEDLDKITIVPNPYLGASAYEVARVTDVVKITNLTERATVRIFTLNGTLIRTLEKAGSSPALRWDLNTEEGLPISSGMYLIHVEAKDSAGAIYGERILKFAVVKKRVQLNEL